MIEPRNVWNYLKKYLYDSSVLYIIGVISLVMCVIASNTIKASGAFYTLFIIGVFFLLAGYAHDVVSGKYLAQQEKRTRVRTMVPLQPKDRLEILYAAMLKYIDQGYEVTSQMEFTLFMKRERRFSCLWASILTVSGIGLLLYILYYWSKRDNFIAITVDRWGNTIVTKSNEGMIA